MEEERGEGKEGDGTKYRSQKNNSTKLFSYEENKERGER
jgi:hypothetical protein